MSTWRRPPRRAPRGRAAAVLTPERLSLPDLKHLSDLFFNLNDAISHHTLPKYFVYLAKSHTNKNDTLKFPNELQLRNSSAEAGMENAMNLGLLT